MAVTVGRDAESIQDRTEMATSHVSRWKQRKLAAVLKTIDTVATTNGAVGVAVAVVATLAMEGGEKRRSSMSETRADRVVEIVAIDTTTRTTGRVIGIGNADGETTSTAPLETDLPTTTKKNGATSVTALETSTTTAIRPTSTVGSVNPIATAIVNAPVAATAEAQVDLEVPGSPQGAGSVNETTAAVVARTVGAAARVEAAAETAATTTEQRIRLRRLLGVGERTRRTNTAPLAPVTGTRSDLASSKSEAQRSTAALQRREASLSLQQRLVQYPQTKTEK